MNFNEYQELAARTRSKSYVCGDNTCLAVNALGLTGESGEIADIIKKHIGHGHPVDAEAIVKIKKELGDVLWYVAEMASAWQLSLENIAAANIEKLRARYPEGFSTERSVNREPENQAAPADPFAAAPQIVREAYHFAEDGQAPMAPPEGCQKRYCTVCGHIAALTPGGFFLPHGANKNRRCPALHTAK